MAKILFNYILRPVNAEQLGIISCDRLWEPIIAAGSRICAQGVFLDSGQNIHLRFELHLQSLNFQQKLVSLILYCLYATTVEIYLESLKTIA